MTIRSRQTSPQPAELHSPTAGTAPWVTPAQCHPHSLLCSLSARIAPCITAVATEWGFRTDLWWGSTVPCCDDGSLHVWVALPCAFAASRLGRCPSRGSLRGEMCLPTRLQEASSFVIHSCWLLRAQHSLTFDTCLPFHSVGAAMWVLYQPSCVPDTGSETWGGSVVSSLLVGFLPRYIGQDQYFSPRCQLYFSVFTEFTISPNFFGIFSLCSFPFVWFCSSGVVFAPLSVWCRHKALGSGLHMVQSFLQPLNPLLRYPSGCQAPPSHHSHVQ